MNKISTNYMELVPAYGRDYKSKADVEKAFREGKDFSGDYSIGFAYTSIRDFTPGTKVCLRYRRNEQITIVVV